jgi:hypothetical protein
VGSQDTQASLFGADDTIGVVRQKTRVKVVVHSHIEETPSVRGGKPGVVDCSDDTISMDTSKTIKGTGSASITLVARVNYINYVFPNDWITIWVNPGDGRGFIKVFFGFVDRIDRVIQTDAETGATTTLFKLSCSDFTKAFDITHVYFNPYIADREDFVGEFAGTKNLAGAALRTKGVTVFGSPVDIVLSYAHLLMGFGAQFVAPKSYVFNQALLEESRKFRRDWAKSRLSKEVLKEIGSDTIAQWLAKLKKEAKGIEELLAEDLRTGNHDNVFNYAGSMGLSDAEANDLVNQFVSGEGVSEIVQQVAVRAILSKRGLPTKLLTDDASIKAGLAIEETAAGQHHLLDLIDFSLVEHAAIDGSIVATSIWTQQGTLWSLMNSYSNSMVNELFMDLRPLSKNFKEKALSGGGYARIKDELVEKESETGVMFVPSMIMREYPFSTVRGYFVAATVLGKPVEDVLFGALFSNEPNIPGRKIISIPAISDTADAEYCFKHLDVAVISVLDIASESVGRSDVDVVNLLEVYSDLIGKNMKFMMQDIQPIAIPISVARHGLRVRSYTTRFARFSKKVRKKGGVDTVGTRRKLVRWAMLLDHWYQHNAEYLNGSITTRAFPEIRVGFRLDISERRESYYVEGVNHSWNYPEPMSTTFTVSRGQRNDPYPVYEKPAIKAIGGDRKSQSRLADMFRQKDPSAVVRAVRGHPSELSKQDNNFTDTPTMNVWGNKKESFLIADSFDYTGILSDSSLDFYLGKIKDEGNLTVLDAIFGGDQDSIIEGLLREGESEKKKRTKKLKAKGAPTKGSPKGGVKK